MKARTASESADWLKEQRRSGVADKPKESDTSVIRCFVVAIRGNKKVVMIVSVLVGLFC